ncbi:MAG: SDR family NAD(P)-dependent oxidoreductase [Xanthomonadales bacterium]|nr:SDR family NAD(P)-dependent oxidoreductase [Xanthomonadales bacterium]
MSRQLAEKGADLLLLDNNDRALVGLSDSIQGAGFAEPGVCPLDLAVAGDDACRHLSEIISEQYGGLDILIHCAAAFHGLQPLEHVSVNQWHEMVQVNLNAPWLLSTTCLPFLRASDAGKIVFILEDERIYGLPFRGAYAASKAGLASLAQTLAEELEGSNVSVLKFYPPAMRTELRARAYHSENPKALRDPRIVASELVEKLL